MLDSDAPVGPADSVDNTPADAAPVTPPRRRRAASRPAGPPAPAPAIEAAEAPAEPVESAPDTDTVADPVDDAVAEQDTPAEVAAEEEAPEEAEAAAEEAEPEAVEPVEPGAEEPAAEATPEPAPEPAPARAPRRRRATRAAGPAEAAPEPAPADAATEAPAEPEQADQPEAPARPARRSRRRTPAAEPAPEAVASEAPAAEATAEASGDPVGEQLAELAEQRPGRRRRVSAKVANPFSPADVSAALDDLAAAISGKPAPEATTEDEAADDESAEATDGVPADEQGDAAASDDTDTEGDDTDAEASEDGEGDTPRRRRRRRGGRRRRRSSDGDADAEASDDDGDDDSDDEASDDSGEGGDAEASTDEPATTESSSRRRRRRRRRGEDTNGEPEAEDGVDVVVKVREPRKPSTGNDQITGIEGSTRMEAKRQRRREGRAAGRRRAPILSEAEFLARRESVERQMLIRQADDYTQIAVLEDGVLVEHYVDRSSAASMIGNIYLGRVQNVLPSMEAAFIDIGRGRNAVLYAGEVDWDAFGVTGADRKVEKVLKSGQAVLVQVTKDPVGAKGARLTSHISIPGRYVVYAPGGHLSGISRKLPENERGRLKAILDEVVGEDASVIVRTAAEGASEDELVRDVSRLKAQWEVIDKKVKGGQAPQLLYSEPDLTVRIVRDLFTEDFGSLVVDGNGQGEDAYDTVQAYVTHVAPHLQERLRHWQRESEGDLFAKFRVHEQVAKALERKVHLPSGGSLIIDRTEAMTVVDVNTGKFTGSQGNLEATVTSNNLEAAEEIVRQLRLRDIGGIIVIDFIDMVLPANRELLLRRLVECLGRDRTRHQVAEVTSLGLVQMTRKKIGTGLHEAFTVPCETCSGRGYHVHDSPVSTQAPADGGDRPDSGRRGRGSAAQRRIESRPTPPALPAPAPAPEAPAEASASDPA